LRAAPSGRCNRRMGEIIRHVLAVLPATLVALGIDLAAASR
jgi:hypothetical protein